MKDEDLDSCPRCKEAEPVAWLVLNSSEGYVERNPDVVAFLEAAGLTKCKPLFAPPALADSDLICAINRLLDSDGSRGTFSAIKCSDAREEIERLLAAAPEPGGDHG
ncbi:hypothetical protein [Pantoea sp. BAV 3049]|uniref:hypothetical protein n=1 Tax=Pantoea sp. BAV 3049 TaxID=2654188 RepID=UPI00131D9725|nr:hypothetical protein [Pantoea sp. BAV 3049]